MSPGWMLLFSPIICWKHNFPFTLMLLTSGTLYDPLSAIHHLCHPSRKILRHIFFRNILIVVTPVGVGSHVFFPGACVCVYVRVCECVSYHISGVVVGNRSNSSQGHYR